MLPAIWINGKREAASALHISARDRGLLLADGVFETMRARGRRIFRVDQHLARLHEGLRRLAIPPPGEIADWLQAALPESHDGEVSVRLTVTRGAGAAGVPPPPDLTATVIVSINPMPPFAPSIYERGLSAQVAVGRRNEFAATSGMKTLAYTDAIAAVIEAQRAGMDEAIFLDTQGHCSEATASNLFIVRSGEVLTPPRACAALPGITRAAVIELAPGMGLNVVERACTLTELMTANEAFLTSSLRGIAPLTRLDGQAIGGGAPGEVTGRIAAAYAALVADECPA